MRGGVLPRVRRGSGGVLQRPLTRRWLTWTVGLLGVGVAVFLLSIWLPPQFTVTEIVVFDARPEIVEDVRRIVAEVIAQHAVIGGRPNIFRVPRSFLEEELPQRIPAIHTVQILRRLPGTVRVTVQEKVPVAILYAGATYYALDPAGIVFEVVPAELLQQNTLPVVRDERADVHVNLGQQVLSAPVLAALHDLAAQLPERFALTLREITIPAIGAEEFHVRTNEGWLLLLDARRPLTTQFAILEKLFTEELGEDQRARLRYVDLRVAGKAFYQLQGE